MPGCHSVAVAVGRLAWAPTPESAAACTWTRRSRVTGERDRLRRPASGFAGDGLSGGLTKGRTDRQACNDPSTPDAATRDVVTTPVFYLPAGY